MAEELSVRSLEAAFAALRLVLPTAQSAAPKQFYPLADLKTAFGALRRPLSVARERGGLINFWALAGIGQDEVRNAAALSGLWMVEFGGDASRAFLGSYLSRALPGVDWCEELARGYRVETEVCPLGDIADRVDLIVETAAYLIGVEVKIRAGLGREQLERYIASIHRRAELQGLTPRILLLAPFETRLATVSSTTWHDVARAARAVASGPAGKRSFVQHVIDSFAEHVCTF
ncbi:hypothetical protein QLH51_04235 [Sphingomonas sp. 2R-10]|uniref:PD-(D/E)XK nuclease family protein n=1 Tax=Sphingomonas sp. 2R-10 TaxID=3045148 RepID=UPI0024BB2AFB|nr:PD-(D/E)XK nuclease family protein [Sphingomonas sp. 2R-10]MDJ0276013.1 hypothetical protein [Sphingomonas sp. 2R-10]